MKNYSDEELDAIGKGYEGHEPEAHEAPANTGGCEVCDGTGMKNGNLCKLCLGEG